MGWTDRIVALSLLAGILPLWTMTEVFSGTAAVFPRAILATVAVLAALLFVRSLIPGGVRQRDFEGTRDRRGLVPPLLGFVAALGGVALMPFVGFFPAMAALAALALPVLDVERRWEYVAATLVVLTFVYVVFVLLLGVPLAVWPLGQR